VNCERPGTKVATLEGGSAFRMFCMATVWMPSCKQRQLWTGSFDNCIYIYNIKTHELIQTLKGHDDYVSCMISDGDGTVWSGSRDKTIRTWSF